MSRSARSTTSRRSNSSRRTRLSPKRRKNTANTPRLYELVDGDNPLRDSFVITYEDNSKASTTVYQVNHIDGIAKVNFRLDLVTTIEKIKSGISLVLIWFMAILFVVSIFVIINTIKLAVPLESAPSITIMRYVGATEWFVILPFIFEGIIIGLISSGLASSLSKCTCTGTSSR